MTKSIENKRIENNASQTAWMATFYRFLMNKDKRMEVGRTDNLAYIFMPPKVRFFLSFTFFRNLITKRLHKKFPGTYEYIIARTRFFDEIFIHTAKEKGSQIVFLGAGYDTRAIRFQRLTKDTVIYELDTPLTQKEKKKYFERNKIRLPENIIYVPVNFSNDDLKQALLKNGYDPKKKTLFIWEGVTMYLNPQSVKETLSFIKDNSGLGSTIVFDYFYDSVIKGTSDSIGAMELSDAAGELGEKFNFGVEEGRIIVCLIGPYLVPDPPATVSDLVDHIDYAVKLIGIDHVGIGSDFDGGGGLLDCRNASQVKNITRELFNRGYSQDDIRKIWGGNLLRVFRQVALYADK